MLSYFSCVRFFATCGLTVARQTPPSVGFSRQEYWSGLPFLPPGDLPDPGVEPGSLTSPALAGRFFTTNTTWEAHRESKKTRVLAFTWKGCGRVAGGEHTPHPSADCVLQGGLVCPVLSPPPSPSLPPVWGPCSGPSCIFYMSIRAAGDSKCLKIKSFLFSCFPAPRFYYIQIWPRIPCLMWTCNI